MKIWFYQTLALTNGLHSKSQLSKSFTVVIRSLPTRLMKPNFNKELDRLLQRKHHLKLELFVGLSVLQLFYVDHVIQNGRSVLLLDWHKWFSYKGREWKFTAAWACVVVRT